jgi:hypothetical protein
MFKLEWGLLSFKASGPAVGMTSGGHIERVTRQAMYA